MHICCRWEDTTCLTTSLIFPLLLQSCYHQNIAAYSTVGNVCRRICIFHCFCLSLIPLDTSSNMDRTSFHQIPYATEDISPPIPPQQFAGDDIALYHELPGSSMPQECGTNSPIPKTHQEDATLPDQHYKFT